MRRRRERRRWGHRSAAAALAALLLGGALAAPAGAALPEPSGEAAELTRALAEVARLAGSRAASGAAGGARGAAATARPASDPAAVLDAYDRLRAADLLLAERFAAVGERLAAIGASAEVVARWQRAEAESRRAVEAVLAPLAEPVEALRRGAGGSRPPSAADLDAALAAAAAAVAEAAAPPPPPELLRAAVLPYGTLSLGQRAPAEAAAVVPAYLDPTDAASTPADLAASPLAPLSDPILLQAEALGYDAVRIFELVHDGIESEHYAGAMKGAEETLRQGRGNDADQAALLVALLRASGVPARFVWGVVERPIEDLAAELRLAGAGAEMVAEALRRAGVAFRPVVRGGRVAAFEVEHVWVAARVPYANYRGAVVDFSGPAWVPLAPAIERYQVRAAAGVLAALEAAGEHSTAAFVAEVLASPQALAPLALLRSRVEDHLAASGGGAYDDILARRTLAPRALSLLPSTLPVRVAAVHGEATALPEALVHRVRLTVRAGAGAEAPAVLSWTAPLAELAGRRVTLSYLPATVEDQRVVAAFGGLHGVPLYLVQLRPQVKVDGRPRAVAEAAVDAGVPHRLEVELAAPFGGETAGRLLVAGGYYALALGAQAAPPRGEAEDAPPDPADGEYAAARILSGLAADYAGRWSDGEEELAALAGVTVLRPLGSLVIAAGAVRIDTLLGLPEQLRWQGVTLDAALRVAEPVAGATAAGAPPPGAAADWLALAALHGSALEHRVFEEDFLVDGISADKGLALARAAGLEVMRLTAADLPLPAALDHPPAVLAEIEDRLRLGFEVEVPRGPVQRNAWRGSVWRVVDPAGRGAGYFLAGGLAGGATTEPPDSWVLDHLADALAGPYAPPPVADALSAAEVVKLPAGDGQVGTVGEVYPRPLSVLVRDDEGRPVSGATVTFSVWSGGGRLIGADGGETTQVAAVTNALGQASATLRAGTRTEDDPVYLLRDPGDRHVSRALVDTVEVLVESRRGPLAPTAPFQLTAFAGPPAALRKTSPSEEIHRGWPSVWAGSLQVAVEDAHGNPVANVPVEFRVDGRFFEPSCLPPEEFLPAVVFDECPARYPRLGDCGGPVVSVVSSTFGASAGVILGDTVLTVHRVVAEAPGLTPVEQRYLAQTFISAPPFHCKTLPGVLHTDAVLPVDAEGRNIAAARAGTPMQGPLDIVVLYARPKSGDPQSAEYSRMDWVPVDGTLSLTVGNGGFATTPVRRGAGRYQSSVTTGPVAGPNDVELALSGVEVMVLGSDGELVPEVRSFEPGFLARIWGVVPEVVRVSPDPPVLGPSGQTTSELSVEYRIAPDGYRAGEAELDLYDDDELSASAIGSAREGTGQAVVQRGYPFDVEHGYDLEVVLNRGSVAEVRSDRFRLPLYQKLLRDVTPFLVLDMDVDALNQRACALGAELRYTLSQAAAVTLEMLPVESLETDGSRNLGSPIVLLDAVEQGEGEQRLLVTPDELPAGDYEFVLRAVALADGQSDEERGAARSELRVRDSLPVGHVLVHGVDLWDGHLAVSREDLAYPGRGPALAFRRTYSSNAGGEPGPLGVGWSHEYESRVVVTPCGEAIVVGGEGSGMRFVPDGPGRLRPLRGYHGTLLPGADHPGFDFYTKGGVHYRYSRVHGRELLLESIADPNGNTTRLVYEAGADGAPRLAAVVGPSGRRLAFRYALAQFATWAGEVLVAVEGPDGSGHSLAFEYDPFGNLARAAREGGARVESYVYADAVASLEDRHLLVAITDDVGGGTTSYAYERGVLRATGDIVVPSAFYTSATLPEGGETRFAYDLAGLASRAGPTLVARVEGPRGGETVYELDQYGSPLAVTDPLGHVSRMTWAADDVVMTSRTDAKGITTTYEHDEHGNTTAETLSFPDADGGVRTETRSWQFAPPESFDPPYIKDRPVRRVDRDGAVAELAYDSRANVVEERVTVADADGATRELVTRHTVLANGDRASTTDPRGEVSRFTYDAHGLLASTTDPLGARTVTVHDVRGLPIRRVDPLGRAEEATFDTLGRPLRRVLPRAAGEGEAPAETWTYDDTSRTTVASDAAGRATTTTRDREGRIVRLENPAGGVKLFVYDAAGDRVTESNWHDAATPRADTTFVHDLAGRLAERREPLGRTAALERDAVGNVVRETLFDRDDPAFAPRVTEMVYDGLDRRIEVRRLTGGEPVVERFRFSGEGDEVWRRDARGFVTETEWDALRRPIRRREPEGKETVLLYDGVGNVVEERRLNEVDGERVDQVRRFVWDGAGRRVQEVDALGHARLFEHDLAGNLLREIDRRLSVVSHEYDERNRRVATTRHLTRVSEPRRTVTTRFAYDAVGNLVEERWPNGNVVTHAWDALDRPIARADALGPLFAATYDANGNRLTETDAEGGVTTTAYDALHRPVRIERPEERTTSIAWDVAGNRVAETGPRGFTTRMTYDRLDRLVEVEDPEPFGHRRLYAYDAAGNRTAETDRRGHTTRFEYDGLGRLVRGVAPPPLSYETVHTYDRVGNRLSVTDPRGVVTETRYDLENRPLTVRRAGLLVATQEYDAEGNLRFLTDANGHVTGFEVDERNLTIAENRPLAAITRHRLDDMGDRVESIDPEGRRTEWSRDPRRRVIAETDPAGETTSYAYDGKGNRTRLERPESNAWTFRYDGADRLVEVEDPEGGLAVYVYDAAGNRTAQTDANGHTTSFEYDELDRMTARIAPGGAREGYRHDEEGNVVERTDPLGQVTATDYDPLGREVLRTYSLPAVPGGDDLASVSTEHDPNGNVVQVTETYTGATGTRTTVSSWDLFDRLESVTDPHGERLTYAYDASGNRLRLTDPDGRVTATSFDALNRPVAVTVAGAGTTEYRYLRDGRLAEVRYPNGTSSASAYDAAGRLATIENRQGAATVSRYAYDYDGNGNRLRQVEENGAGSEETTYRYDALDRLVEVAYPGETATYAWDAAGNRLEERVVETTTGTALVDRLFAYDDRDRLLLLTDRLDPDGSVAYEYDASGNQTARRRGAEITLLRYDVLDRLVEVRRDGQPVAHYLYDHQGLRVARRVGTGATVRSVYDDGALLLETDLAGTTLVKYEYGPDRLLSLDHASEGRQFYLFDGLGSPVTLTGAGGAVEARYRWDAWGESRGAAGESPNRFGFTGHELDAETGLYYAKARYYDPDLGLFLTEDPAAGDPLRPPSLHRYLYAYGNPTVYVDPTGWAAEPAAYKWTSVDDVPPGKEYFVVRVGDREVYYSADRADWPQGHDVDYRIASRGERRTKEETLWDKAKGAAADIWNGWFGEAKEEVDEARRAFEDAERNRPRTGASDEEDAQLEQKKAEQRRRVGIVFEESGEAGVEVAEGTVRAADDLSAMTGGGKILREGVEAGVRQGMRRLGPGAAREGAEEVAEREGRRSVRDGSSAANRASHERYADELRSEMERPAVENGALSRIMDDLYRPGATVGSGSTAAAVRHEAATGERVGGRLHEQKAREAVTRLENWLERNPTARPGDRAAAENVLRDLRNALDAGR